MTILNWVVNLSRRAAYLSRRIARLSRKLGNLLRSTTNLELAISQECAASLSKRNVSLSRLCQLGAAVCQVLSLCRETVANCQISITNILSLPGMSRNDGDKRFVKFANKQCQSQKGKKCQWNLHKIFPRDSLSELLFGKWGRGGARWNAGLGCVGGGGGIQPISPFSTFPCKVEGIHRCGRSFRFFLSSSLAKTSLRFPASLHRQGGRQVGMRGLVWKSFRFFLSSSLA